METRLPLRSLWQKQENRFLTIWEMGSILFISPLCMYRTIPLAASFSRYGISDDWLAAFMMSFVLLNPQLIIYSAVLETTALAIRISSCFLCGITAGLLVWFCCGKDGDFFRFDAFEESKSRDTDPNIILRFLKNLGRNIKATGLYFLFGIVLSVLFQRYVPADTMTAIFSGNEAFGVLIAATVGVPLYACGGGTIPLLQVWLSDSMSMGGAAAFMITGSATKITNLGALKIVLVIYVMFSAFAMGLLINIFV